MPERRLHNCPSLQIKLVVSYEINRADMCTNGRQPIKGLFDTEPEAQQAAEKHARKLLKEHGTIEDCYWYIEKVYVPHAQGA